MVHNKIDWGYKEVHCGVKVLRMGSLDERPLRCGEVVEGCGGDRGDVAGMLQSYFGVGSEQGQEHAVYPGLHVLREFDGDEEDDAVGEHHEEQDGEVPPLVPARRYLQNIRQHILPCDARPRLDVVLER